MRIVLLLTATVCAMIGLGIFYERVVQPKEAVFQGKIQAWDKDKIPLTVHAENPQYQKALKVAVGLINSQVGCAIVKADEVATVLVKEDSIRVGGESEDWAAGAFVAKDLSYGEILIWRPLMVGTDLKVIHHEIGHLFDLAHDRAYSMAPVTKENLDGPQGAVRFSDKDAAALKNLYCP